MKCPVCGSTEIVIDQKLDLKGTKVKPIYLHAVCQKCHSVLIVEYSPTSVRQQTVD